MKKADQAPPETGTPSVESILNTVIDAIIAIDESGVMQSVNPAAEKIFGYSSSEMIGKNVSILMPNPYSREHDGYIRKYLKTGKANIIGIGREVTAKRKDGSLFPVYLGVNEGGKRGGRRFFTGVIRDITEMKRYQDDLKKQHEFTATVLNTVRSLVLVLDSRGDVVNFNRACEEMTGYTFQEVAGRPFWDFFVKPRDKEQAVRNFLTSDPKHFPNHFETPWLTKSGEARLIAWSNSAIFGKKGALEYVIGTGIDITERRRLERTILEITKNEQRRIGQELHDGIAQHLTHTAIVAKMIEKKLALKSAPAAREVKRVVTLVNEAISQTRELAQGLYALETQPEDLLSSLSKLAHDTQKTVGIRCEFESGGVSPALPEGTAAHLYRIAREAVNNAVKHGRGRNIWIRVDRINPREMRLVVENDGRPFVKSAKQKGLGMRMMQSRAAIIRASLVFSKRPEGGTRMSCIFPVMA